MSFPEGGRRHSDIVINVNKYWERRLWSIWDAMACSYVNICRITPRANPGQHIQRPLDEVAKLRCRHNILYTPEAVDFKS